MPRSDKGSAKDRHTKKQMNVRLSEQARDALSALAELEERSETQWIERMIREKAKQKGLWKE